MKKARFEIGQLLPIGLTLVVLGIAIAYGLQVLGTTAEDYCDGTLQHYVDSTGSCYRCPNSTWNVAFQESNSTCANDTTHHFQGVATLDQTLEFNATQQSMQGVAQLPAKLPTIVTVIVAAVIIGILVRYLWVRFA